MKPETAKMIETIVTVCFVGTWIVLGIGSFFVFSLGKDVAFKRKWYPRLVILAGVLFVFFVTTIAVLSARSLQPLGLLLVLVPMVCLISYLNIKFTKFRGNCGQTIYSQNWFTPTKFCSKCGAKLDLKTEPDDRFLE